MIVLGFQCNELTFIAYISPVHWWMRWRSTKTIKSQRSKQAQPCCSDRTGSLCVGLHHVILRRSLKITPSFSAATSVSKMIQDCPTFNFKISRKRKTLMVNLMTHHAPNFYRDNQMADQSALTLHGPTWQRSNWENNTTGTWQIILHRNPSNMIHAT